MRKLANAAIRIAGIFLMCLASSRVCQTPAEWAWLALLMGGTVLAHMRELRARKAIREQAEQRELERISRRLKKPRRRKPEPLWKMPIEPVPSALPERVETKAQKEPKRAPASLAVSEELNDMISGLRNLGYTEKAARAAAMETMRENPTAGLDELMIKAIRRMGPLPLSTK